MSTCPLRSLPRSASPRHGCGIAQEGRYPLWSFTILRVFHWFSVSDSAAGLRTLAAAVALVVLHLWQREKFLQRCGKIKAKGGSVSHSLQACFTLAALSLAGMEALRQLGGRISAGPSLQLRQLWSPTLCLLSSLAQQQLRRSMASLLCVSALCPLLASSQLS